MLYNFNYLFRNSNTHHSPFIIYRAKYFYEIEFTYVKMTIGVVPRFIDQLNIGASRYR